MEVTQDELAGVVDLFGGLTRVELADALDELAFKRASDPPGDDVVADAVRTYALVEYDRAACEPLLVAGPAAFPSLPDGAADLPHILDVPEREIDREALAAHVESRFRADAARAVADGDDERIAHLLDVSYDLETWGSVDLAGARDRLDAGRTN
ncbi:MAG: hypothetical protein ABEJ23_03910 [Haloarculaceae archaeon]